MDDKKSYAEPVKIGEVMPGDCLSTVVTSKHPNFHEGDVIIARQTTSSYLERNPKRSILSSRP